MFFCFHVGLPCTFCALNGREVVVLHTGGIHGQIESKRNDNKLEKIGLDIVKNVKDSFPNSVLVDAGNAIQGSFLGKCEKGSKIINLMNLVGYDIAGLGDQDFENGVNEVKNMAKKANFQILSANLKNEKNKVFLDGINGSNGANLIKEINGIRIGFFGITTSGTKNATPPSKLKGISFEDELECSKQQVKNLKYKKKVDVIIGIMNSDDEIFNKITAGAIAESIGKDLNIIINGHRETSIENINGVTILQAGEELSGIGCIKISFKNNKLNIETKPIRTEEAGSMFKSDVNIERHINGYLNEINSQSEKVIGKTQNSLFGGIFLNKNINCFFETPMGNLVCDSMVWRIEKLVDNDLKKFKNLHIVAYEKGSSIKKSINKGYITMSNLLESLPLDNKLTCQIISPKDLFSLLEKGFGKIKLPDRKNGCFTGNFGEFPQVSGIKIEYDITKKAYDYEKDAGGNRVVNLFLTDKHGKEIERLSREDDKPKILFLCDDYVLHEFPSISSKEIIYKEDKNLSNTLSEYILHLTLENNRGFECPFSKKRIVMKNYKNYRFDAELILKKSGEILPLTQIEIKIDDKHGKKYFTDKNGKIFLRNLDGGPHKILAKYGNDIQETLVSNFGDLKNIEVVFDGVSSGDDYEKVSNIIGQIPYNITKEDIDFINFARTSYDLLEQEFKEMVFNYPKLENAEKEILKIRGNVFTEFFPNNNIKKIASLFFLIISFALLVYIFKKYKNKLKIMGE
ncbi:MAG: 5'-nucleotidase C-terminal domain-containing protein [Candidatus Improbicoccus pseudotrichonymphae]|uniref:5'-nucleotidase C-terminal domain-containing protein n=1 Tax=Candidatus Improbicoccus pseudotrichonymphae TaxID=3033792 RepID=A0AA48I2B6_9FIRM|nr:MAG: 5'-nucleotidase C-terminal domain-containing protein [Candidatus Improbicoccus pseudotrichonymphae]